MNYNFRLDKQTRQALLETESNAQRVGTIGCICDFSFMHQDKWLQDSAVIGFTRHDQGQWIVYLAFAHYCNPFQVIIRRITTCMHPEKAEIYARYMQRQAAKDARGTLTVDNNFFAFNLN